VEQPTVIHAGANHGSVAVHVMIASLFPDGAPSAIPVK
jgi:hypothetical protein